MRMRLHWNGCGLLLHEYCHLIHQYSVQSGLDNPEILKMFQSAKDSGLYAQVLRRDWAGKDVDCDMAYALIDHKEFFAEMSVSFLSQAYSELDCSPFPMMEKATPPLLEPGVRSRVKSVMKSNEWDRALTLPDDACPSHCNKFFPFTSGQLKHFDQCTYRSMYAVWSDISHWDDNQVSSETCCFWRWSGHVPTSKPTLRVHSLDTVDL